MLSDEEATKALIFHTPLRRLYIFGFVASLLFFGGASLYTWFDLKGRAQTELRHQHALITTSVEDRLAQQASMLKILGQRLLEIGLLSNKHKGEQLLDKSLQENPVFIAYGLATPKGKLVLTSHNLRNKKLPNLLQSQQTSESFVRALQTQGLTVGRTYYFPELGKWIIPLRYAIRDNQGNTVAVMTAGIDLHGAYNLWSSYRIQRPFYLNVVKASNRKGESYNQYSQPLLYPNSLQKTYNNPIPRQMLRSSAAKITKATQVSMKTFMEQEKTAQYSFYNSLTQERMLIQAGYNKRYRIFTVLGVYYSYLWNTFSYYLGAYLLILLLFNIVHFVLFRHIDNKQHLSNLSLERQATHDALTSLPNRTLLKAEFSGWKRQHPDGFALLYLDLDNFKHVNDHYGHTIGDTLLIEVSQRLFQCCGSKAQLYRQGGDEFIILYPSAVIEEIQQAIEHCRERLNKVISIDNLEFKITSSYGVVTSELGSQDLEGMLSHADIAMYEAKRKQIPYTFFTESMLEESVERATIEKAMLPGLENEEFFLVYQPQIDAKDKSVLGVEVLLRWNSKEHGFIRPDKFIAVAETCGHINLLGEFVLKTAFKELKHLSTADKPLRISINASVHQILDNNFPKILNAQTQLHGISPANVVVEITESVFIEDINNTKKLLQRLQDDGYLISLDDFGTGYSSLSLINKLPIGEIKIDKSFVRDINTDENDRALIKSMIGIGQSLQIPVLAEGVEELDQAQTLKNFGCDSFQGYYFGKPMPQKDLEQYLQNYQPSEEKPLG